jgi:VWFA-related protein
LRQFSPQITQTARILFLTLTLLAPSFAQTPAPPKRKTKDFGSSLKKLQWNSKTQTAELRSKKRATKSDEEDVIRIETSLVSCDLLVVDRKGNPVSGLTADDFSIAEDSVPQSVGHFFKGDNADVPRTIVLIIDYSGSQLPFLSNSVQAAKLLVDKIGPRDLMAIVTDDVDLLVDFTTDKQKLKEKLDSLLNRVKYKTFPRDRLGKSEQYSALMATLNEMFTEEDVRRIVIFQTDGDEAYFLKNTPVTWPNPIAIPFFNPASLEREFALGDLYRAVERERVTLYSVIPGIRFWGLPPEEQLRKNRTARADKTTAWMAHLPAERRAQYLKQVEKEEREEGDEKVVLRKLDVMGKLQAMLASLATVSGGWADFLEKPDQADAIYSRIFSDINQRYIVGYYPTNKEHDGKRRKIDFQVKGHPEYQVLGRGWYFAPAP